MLVQLKPCYVIIFNNILNPPLKVFSDRRSSLSQGLWIPVALSTCDYMQSEIRNVLTTIHSFPSKQWMTQRQCVYEFSYWHNIQLICVKRIKNSWMTISSVKISYPAECNCHLLYRMTSESYLMSSLPLLHLYISQCKFCMSCSFQDHQPLVQHGPLRTTSSSTYEINY